MRKKITLILFFGLFSYHGLLAQACGTPGNPNPDPPVFSFSANNVCAQTDVTMSVDSPQGGITYTWDFGDNSLPVDSIPEGTSVVHAFAPNDGGASYTVTVYAESSSGCITTYSATMTTLATPDIEADGVFSACLASNSTQTSFTTTILITNHNGGSYDWDFGDGTMISTTDTEVTHTFVGYGTFDLVISQSNGTCTGTFTQTVRFLKRPTANMNIVGDADICEGDTLFVANNTASTNVDFYVLDWGDGQRDTLIGTDTLFHVYDFSDVDPCTFPQVGLEMDVELIAVNQCFEHSNGSPIFVSIPPQTQFSGPGTVICASDPVVDFSNFTCPNGGGGFDSNNYVWTFGDPSTGSLDTAYTIDPTHSFSGPGTYTITLTASSNCGSVTSTGEIIVYEDAFADGDYTTNSPIVTSNGDGCGPLEVAVLENSTGDSLSVDWSVSPAAGWTQTGGDSITPVYTFTDPGTYTLSLGANNLCGSSSWDTTVVIIGQPTATLNPIPNGCDSYSYNPVASFTNGGGTISGYSWSFPGATPSTSSAANPTNIEYSSPGTYTVTVDVTTECGTSSDSQTFTIYASP
ncbi:MAG: PKD domain-containing protein, partial [Bacteroidota bacterium]